MPAHYNNALSAYFEWFSHLMIPPDVDDNGGRAMLNHLADRVDGFAVASEDLTKAAQTFLDAPGHRYQLQAIDSLINQIEGDLAIANMLWDIISRLDSEADTLQIIGQSFRRHSLRDVYRALRVDMTPIQERSAQSSSIAKDADNLTAALDQLRYEIDNTLDVVRERATTVGLQLVRDTFQTVNNDQAIIDRAITLLRGHQQVGDVGWGLEDDVPSDAWSLTGGLRSVLVNVVEKILIIIEKNDLVRYIIADWLAILLDQSPSVRRNQFQAMLEQLYQINLLRDPTLDIWLQDAIQAERANACAQEIAQLATSFDHLASQIRQAGAHIQQADMFQNPRLQHVGAALQVGLLATLVFAGYDHIDDGSRTLNVIRGVREVLIEDLPVSPSTRRQADNLVMGAQKTRRPART